MQMIRRVISQLFFFIFALVLIGLPVASAQEESTAPPRLDLSSAVTDNFPIIRLTVISTDGRSNRLPLPSDLQIIEDGIAIEDSEISSEPLGVDFIFVIDANSNIRSRDDASGLTRQEKVRDSIVLFATEFMSQSQLDSVSIIVPDGDQARFLVEDAMFPNEVINEINFYDPAEIGETPLNEMMSKALDKAEDTTAAGKFQAVLLFSDAGPMGQQLDYDTLVAKAQSLNVPIFGAILGAVADNNEISNMERLSQPTRGIALHMPQAEAIVPIYSTVEGNGEQHIILYRSKINSSGSHEVILESGGSQAGIGFEMEVLSPSVEMALDNSAPITRVADSYDTPLNAANPVNQLVAARVLWPDGNPRDLTEAVFQVDGSDQMSLSDPQIGDDGLLTFDWDISNLGDGTYNLIVRVTDELGLEGVAEALPVSIVLDIPAPPPATVEAPPQVEVEVTQPVEEEASSLANNIGTIGIVIGLLAMMFAVVLVIFAIVLVRRRQTSSQRAVAGSSAAVYADHDATQVIMPAFAAKKAAGAFLEPLENAPDHQGNIPLPGKNVALGRDAKLVQIVFSDKSVSRLHARIVQKGSGYQLYDEGSASGTYLNYEQLSLEPQPLRENDDVHIGRVHLRFHLAQAVGDDDATQVMQAGPIRSPGAAPPVAPSEPIDEDTSTQPYMPLGPQGQSQRQSPGPIDDEDADDISTQPYMPHSPKR
ncbi:MAG: hypothetical protein BMS9Abin02_1519 [Anaerolineae bacterium]|nr:MAG: hypothetical protein BMS9Abin02_1519 [Anaerolineae bacterium]